MSQRPPNFIDRLPPHLRKYATGGSAPNTAPGSDYAKRRIRESTAPLYIQDGFEKHGPVILDSILGHLTDAPIQQIKPTKQKVCWDEDTAMSFALDCAERVLDVFKLQYPNETSIPLLIEVARRYLRGQADKSHVALAMQQVQAFAQKMPQDSHGGHSWAAGEAAGAAWAAVTGKIAEAAESARQAAFGRASGPRRAVTESSDPYDAPAMGQMPDLDMRGKDPSSFQQDGESILERFHEDPNPWETNKRFALALHKSPVITAEADERAWQLQRLEDYIRGVRKADSAYSG